MNDRDTAVRPRRPNAAERERERYWARKTGRHTPYYVPLEPVLRHVEILRTAGLSVTAIAAAAGLSKVALRSAMTHGHAVISAEKAQRILAVRARLDEYPDDTFIPAVGTRRRLRALACMGWAAVQLASESGLPVSTVVKLRAGDVDSVRAWMARAVCGSYARLSGAAAPSGPTATRTRADAGRRGWVPPIAWDDAAIDDPAAVPDLGEYTGRALAVAEDVEFIRSTTGASLNVIAERLGISRDALDQNLVRAKALLAERDPGADDANPESPDLAPIVKEAA